MPRTLIVPGVSVEARFDVPPPLPARSGILGAVGVVDRYGDGRPAPITSAAELLERFGPATRYSFPEALSALTNGVSQVVVAPVAPASGAAAQLTLLDDEDEAVVLLRARAPGPWGNQLGVRVRRTLASDGRTVRRIGLDVYHGDVLVERHDNLVLREGADDDLFTAINRDSGTLVAVDPVYQTDRPRTFTDFRPLLDSGAVPAGGTLPGGGAPLIAVAATEAGEAGNRISVEVVEGRPSLVLTDGTNPSVRLTAARVPGAGEQRPSVRVEPAVDGRVDVQVRGLTGVLRRYEGLESVTQLVERLGADPDLEVRPIGDLLPAATGPTDVQLPVTRTAIVRVEGVRTTFYRDLATAGAIVAALDGDEALAASLLGPGGALPDVGAAYLTGGRSPGLSLGLPSDASGGAAVVELVPSTAVPNPADLRVRLGAGTATSTVRLEVAVNTPTGDEVRETFDDLTMDPDDDGYLPRALERSGLIRAIDRYVRSRATHFPRAVTRVARLTGGQAPSQAAWDGAVDALEHEDEVDLVLAGLQGWADPNLDGLAVQRKLLGHARAMADDARPRIVITSIPPAANEDVPAMLDHAAEVADQRLVLCAPAGIEGAVAGLLGHLNYFESPTFKTVASPGVPLVQWSGGQLDKMLGPEGNLCAVVRKRGRGTICLKGIASNAFQISVTRVADRCVREVRAIADRFVGELNNDDNRNALKQMIVATFTQMERDGALVPSVDGEDPAFHVDVYASQNDAAAGIVRIDIAVRPVRAIDYVYATIRVKN